MTPTQPDIDAALDILDGLTDEQTNELRGHVSRTIRAASRVSEQETLRSRRAIDWQPVEIAMFYVLYITSNEVLERQMI